MSLANYSSAAFTNASGLAVAASASVEVRRESDNALAALFADAAGATPITNPFAADSNGRFSFFVVGIAGGYKVTVTKDADVNTLRSQAIGTAAERDAEAFVAQVMNTPGDIIVGGTAGAPQRKGIGADNAVLMADSSAADKSSYVRLGADCKRQSILSAVLDANGRNAAITTGSGLRPGLDASPAPMVVTFADGFGKGGAQDLVCVLPNDIADIAGSDLPASNTSHLYFGYATINTVTVGHCLVPPQDGDAFDRTQNALLNFNGADASTTMLDDFGNTWTATNNAQLDTAQAKFGASSCLFDGTTDDIRCTEIKTMGAGSWEASFWVRFNVLPTSGNRSALLMFYDAGANFAMASFIYNNAGTTRLELYASSTLGGTNDIANGAVGSNTTWATATWYKIRIVFDALAGTYRVYLSNNGAAESQDISVSSTARLARFTRVQFGDDPNTGGRGFNGWLDAMRIIRCATKTATETPSASAPAITDHPVHWFDVPAMVMREATAASGTAGTPPTFTSRLRLFHSEADTGASSVSAVRNYALRGRYMSPIQIPALGTPINIAHNLGTERYVVKDACAPGVSVAGSGVPTDKVHAWAPAWRGYYFNGSTNVQAGLGYFASRNQLTLYPGLAQMWAMGDDANAVVYGAVRASVERDY